MRDRLDFKFANTESRHFVNNAARDEYIENMTDEYLLLLTTLYSEQLESGTARLKDYNSMTMADVEQELRFRTIVVSGRVNAKERQLRAEHKANEDAFMDELKKASA